MIRVDGRKRDEIRQIKITPNFIGTAAGSVLMEWGRTRVICTATIEDKVPLFLKGTGKGWITAEYSMLPASTLSRKPRESQRGKIEGRTMEIQRLIGRALRSVVDLDRLGERTIWIDCDVIEADGGTRTCSITGGFLALAWAIDTLIKEEKIEKSPLRAYVAAISVGIVNDEPCLDLCYEEDSAAKVDMNLVMTNEGQFVEIQGTGEESPFTKGEMHELLALGEQGIEELIRLQMDTLGDMNATIGEK